jgi:hypothetical protein
MIRQVGPYSTLITPQAGSLFHAVLHPIEGDAGFNIIRLAISVRT